MRRPKNSVTLYLPQRSPGRFDFALLSNYQHYLREWSVSTICDQCHSGAVTAAIAPEET